MHACECVRACVGVRGRAWACVRACVCVREIGWGGRDRDAERDRDRLTAYA